MNFADPNKQHILMCLKTAARNRQRPKALRRIAHELGISMQKVIVLMQEMVEEGALVYTPKTRPAYALAPEELEAARTVQVSRIPVLSTSELLQYFHPRVK